MRTRSVVHSFAPIVDERSRVLILGSMPGIASLRAQQYYAHPHNLFWPILAKLVDLDAAAPYAERTARLLAAELAVWDVLKSCTRSSSLDSDIDDKTLVVNEVVPLLIAHPRLRTVVCNGGKAARVFARHIAPALPADVVVDVHAVPSTSPANASIPYREKLAAWRRALGR